MVNLESIKTEEDLLKLIFDKLFSYSPFKFSKEFIEKKDWYWLHSWSTEEEQEFSTWLYKLYKNSSKARRLGGALPNNSHRIKSGVAMFNFNYGWKTLTKKEDFKK